MANIMVAGVNGFVGKHLVRELVANGYGVIGVGRNMKAAPSIKDILSDYIICDMTNEDEVSKLRLDGVQAIINLAGLAAVGKSFDEPKIYLSVNVSVFTTIAKHIENLGRNNLRVVAVSTGAVYDPGQPLPLTESSKTDPTSSPYAASKIAMEAAVMSFRTKGFDFLVARPFNHIGPGQGPGFLLPDLYNKIKSSDGDQFKVGNLETERDYTDVRDVVRAYIALAVAENLRHDTYNVCSGKPTAGTTILQMLKSACGKPDVKTVLDESLFRPSEQQVLYGDNSRITEETGWRPTIHLEQTIKDFVESMT